VRWSPPVPFVACPVLANGPCSLLHVGVPIVVSVASRTANRVRLFHYKPLRNSRASEDDLLFRPKINQL